MNWLGDYDVSTAVDELESELESLCPWLHPFMLHFYAIQFLKTAVQPTSFPLPSRPESPFAEGEIVEECEHCDGWGYRPHQH